MILALTWAFGDDSCKVYLRWGAAKYDTLLGNHLRQSNITWLHFGKVPLAIANMLDANEAPISMLLIIFNLANMVFMLS